jgi:hypothetical protein
MLRVTISLLSLAHASSLHGIANCSESFVGSCVKSANASDCEACVAGLADCQASEDKVFDLVCKGAPFNSTTADCFTELVTDCSAKFTSKTACEQCVSLHTLDLKKHQCSVKEIAAVTALCSQIPGDN